MIYLASPYSHADSGVREHRYRAACSTAAALISNGTRVFSPIAHSHGIALCMERAESFEFWSQFDLEMLSHCSMLMILTLPGWEHSAGIKAEIAAARQLKIPVYHLDPTTGE